jgi:xylitol oxidase
MASLPHISVAGAVATGTHGSGDALPSLSAAVRRVELVGADGAVSVLAQDDQRFQGGVVALGALGVVTTLDLEVEPTFEVAQTVYVDVPWERVEDRIDAVRAGAYSVSVFTDWQGDEVPQVWVKSRDAGAAPLEGWLPADRTVHMIRDASVEAVTAQQGVPGPWHERLPHFRADQTPSRGQELQSEYFVRRDRATEAFHALRELGDRLSSVLLVSEIRTIAADSLWLSGAYERDTVGLHFTWVLDPPGVLEALGRVEEVLLPLDARPHWGKVFRVGVEELRPMYPKFEDFLELQRTLDPSGTFTNAFLERCLGVA